MRTAQPHEVLRALAARTRAGSQPLAREAGRSATHSAFRSGADLLR